MKLTLRREGENRRWPRYLFWGRMRTSTVGLLVALLATSWVYDTYKPPEPVPAPAAAVVPPGYVPDPSYTWVPRTQVRRSVEPTRTTPTTTSTTVTSTTPTTTSTTPTSTTPTTSTPPPLFPGLFGPSTTVPQVGTTVVDPDGLGPQPPTTVTATAAPVTPLPVPDRSGVSTTVLPGQPPGGPAPAQPGAPR